MPSCEALTFLAVLHRHRFPVSFVWSPHALLALVAGLLILIRPKLLNITVAVYLIIIGVLGLVHLPW